MDALSKVLLLDVRVGQELVTQLRENSKVDVIDMDGVLSFAYRCVCMCTYNCVPRDECHEDSTHTPLYTHHNYTPHTKPGLHTTLKQKQSY